MTLNNKKCECSVKNISHMPYCPLTTKNSEWVNKEEVLKILVAEINLAHAGEVGGITSRLTSAYNQISALQERSKDTVGELIELMEKLPTFALHKNIIGVYWAKEFKGKDFFASTPLEALQKLSEQLNQK